MEKGFYHIFGEYFTSEISFIRNDAPDITACALSLGKEAGKSTCPEQENFRNRYFALESIMKLTDHKENFRNFFDSYAEFSGFFEIRPRTCFFELISVLVHIPEGIVLCGRKSKYAGKSMFSVELQKRV